MNEEISQERNDRTERYESKRAFNNRRPKSNREWKLIEKLLEKSLNEQARSRRWGIFFKALTFIYLFALLWMFSSASWDTGVPSVREAHTAMVEINGMIAEEGPVRADAIVTSLRRAFEAPKAMAVLLRINSPGGSPVQAGLIFDEIRRLEEKYPEKKVYAAITDMGTSGAYYIAAAANEIYADKASIVGSIGVISMGFGFTGLMEKVGIERRVLTSGENKAMLDPFSPLEKEEVKHFKGVLDQVHQQFINSVKLGRGERLKDTGNKIFSGLLWTGEQSVELGLIDGLGSPGYVAREIIGEENIVNYTAKPNPFDVFASKLGVVVSEGLLRIIGSFTTHQSPLRLTN